MEWEKNGRQIDNLDVIAQNHLPNLNATSGTIQLENVSLADAGYYTCVAINPLLPSEPKRSPQALLLVLRKYIELLHSCSFREHLKQIFINDKGFRHKTISTK